MKSCYLVNLPNQDRLYVTPFVDPSTSATWDEHDQLSFFSASSPAKGQKDEALFTLYTQIDRGVDRWIQDVRYLPRLLIGGLIFLVSYFFFSLAVRDPVPMVDELVIATIITVFSLIVIARRDKNSSMSVKRRFELKQNASEVTFEIEEQLEEIVEKFGDTRRTKVVAGKVGEISVEDLIPEEETTMILTSGGYIKRTNPSEFKTQKRGGVGVVDMNTKDEDVVSEFITTSTHADVLFFSSKGKVYVTKMYEIPEGRRSTKGKFISNFLPLEGEEKITSVLALTKEKKKSVDSLMMVTRDGTIKKTAAEAFAGIRANGLIAIKLKGDDELMDARFVCKKDEVMLTTRKGQAIRFKEDDIREMGRTAGGVRGIKLGKADDYVVSMAIITPEMHDMDVFALGSNGYGKRTKLSEYKVQNRGGSGIKTMKVSDKTGDLVGARVITPEHTELIAMSLKSQVIRLAVDEISVLGRDTQGVRIMKLRDGDSVASFVRF